METNMINRQLAFRLDEAGNRVRNVRRLRRLAVCWLAAAIAGSVLILLGLGGVMRLTFAWPALAIAALAAGAAVWTMTKVDRKSVARLVEGSPDVLSLFRRDPFGGHPPAQVRAVLWQYWFTDTATKRATGAWWRRKELGVFSGIVSRGADGQVTFQPSVG